MTVQAVLQDYTPYSRCTRLYLLWALWSALICADHHCVMSWFASTLSLCILYHNTTTRLASTSVFCLSLSIVLNILVQDSDIILYVRKLRVRKWNWFTFL